MPHTVCDHRRYPSPVSKTNKSVHCFTNCTTRKLQQRDTQPRAVSGDNSSCYLRGLTIGSQSRQITNGVIFAQARNLPNGSQKQRRFAATEAFRVTGTPRGHGGCAPLHLHALAGWRSSGVTRGNQDHSRAAAGHADARSQTPVPEVDFPGFGPVMPHWDLSDGTDVVLLPPDVVGTRLWCAMVRSMEVFLYISAIRLGRD